MAAISRAKHLKEKVALVVEVLEPVVHHGLKGVNGKHALCDAALNNIWPLVVEGVEEDVT